jgi:two-component sensor histidine kinase
VTIAWRVSENGKPAFSMSWLEDGGPAVTAPTHKGFGEIVIGRMVEAAVQGATDIAYAAGGFSWRLRAELEDVIAE